MKKRFSVDVNTDANVNHNASLSKKDNEIGIETISYRYKVVLFDYLPTSNMDVNRPCYCSNS